MKNRNDGGYSLALVLVVMIVLATIATTLATVVTSNINSQAQYTQKMQDQYEAQGKLEQVLAELSQNQVVELADSLSSTDYRKTAIQKAIEKLCGTGSEAKASVSAEGVNTIKYWKTYTSTEKVEYALGDGQPVSIIFTYDFQVSANCNETTVTYDLEMKGNLAFSKGTNTYIITSPEIITKSVEVGGAS